MMKTKHSLLSTVILILALAILPLNLISIWVCYTALSSQLASVHSAMTYSLSNTVQLIDTRISNTNSLIFNLNTSNYAGIQYFLQRDDWYYMYDKHQLYNQLADNLTTSNSCDAMFFYSYKQKDWLIVNKSSSNYQFINKEALSSFVTADTSSSIPWRLTYIGEEPVLLRIEYDSPSQVFYGSIIVLSPYKALLSDSISYHTLQILFEDKIVEQVPKKNVYYTSSKGSNLVIHTLIDTNETAGPLGLLIRILFVVIFLYLFLVPFLVAVFIRRINSPLHTLNHAQLMLKEGNEDYRITSNASSREFDLAFDSFNSMAEALKTLRIENVNKEIYNHKLQLEYLRLQIRPHFLLNSFNLLYTLVQNHNEEGAQSMILYLSEYFRYIFKKGSELVLFSKELELIQQYLKISELYYPYDFTVSYQMDPTISLMRVPPLVFHSFMENIIQHALQRDKVTHIVFYGEYEDNIVTINISDDGRGMEPSTVEAINSISKDVYATMDNGKNVGIRNSIQRLKHYYGDLANVEVVSELCVGTTFTIQIPYNLDESDYDYDDKNEG